MKLSVILPARNEEKLIESAVLDITNHLRKKNYSFEVLVVVNGCTDKTEGIARKISKNNRRLKVLKSNPGYGLALRKGLREARGQFIAIFNVDYYNLYLLDLVDIGMYGKDIIIGSKRTYWAEDNRPLTRKTVSLFFNLFLRLAFGFRGSDTHGIKLLRRTKYLAENVSQNGLVLMNMQKGDHTIGVLYETDWYLDVFQNREDIKVEYLDLSKKELRHFYLVSGNLLAIEYEDEKLKKSFGEPLEVMTSGSKIVVTTSINFIKQVLKKSFRSIFNGQPFTADGIYTSYLINNYWNFYKS